MHACSSMRCCHGATVLLRLILIILLFSGFILSCKAARSCRFLFYESGRDDGFAGLFSYEDGNDECVPHEGSLIGATARAARTGAVVAPTVVCLALLLATVEFLSGRTCLWRRLVPVLVLVSAFMQGLTFLLLSSEAFCDVDTVREFFEEAVYSRSCTMSSGSWSSLFALLVYFASAILCWFAPLPEPICAKRSNSKTEADSETLSGEQNKRYSGAAVRISAARQQPSPSAPSQDCHWECEESLAGYGNDSVTLATYEKDRLAKEIRRKAARISSRHANARLNSPQRRAFNAAIQTSAGVCIDQSQRQSGHAESFQVHLDDEDDSLHVANTHWEDEESLAGYGDLSLADKIRPDLPSYLQPGHYRCKTEESLAGFGNETVVGNEEER